jgi:hypothetical protein
MGEGKNFMSKNKKPNGFTAVAVAVFMVALVTLVGWHVIADNNKTKTVSSSSQQVMSNPDPQPPAKDPYAGWKTSVSNRGGFSIRYPADWTYEESLGGKDNVEHITIESANFKISINSYVGRDAMSGGQSARSCTDCLHIINSTSFTSSKLGKINIKTVTYKLDNGQGNALILELPDSTYYINSVDNMNVYTSFRGINILESERAYQSETPHQFMVSADYKTAQKILESVSY